MADLPAHATEPTSRADWRAWLAEHHATAPHVWLVTRKKAAGGPALTYSEAVEEALCVGWVDSVPRTLDAERSMLYVSPRKPRSGWSRPNKERVARLESAGLMRPAGRAAVEAAKANGAWTLLDNIEDLVVPDDLAAAFAGCAGARAHWDAFPPSARRGILEWIVQAKRPETRAWRIADTAEEAAGGRRANQWKRKQ